MASKKVDEVVVSLNGDEARGRYKIVSPEDRWAVSSLAD